MAKAPGVDATREEAKRRAQVLKRQDLFLKYFKKVGTVKTAAARARMSREGVRLWRKNDPAFEQRFQDADLEITGELEDTAIARAKRGNTVLLIFLLKARKPLVYRDHFKVEHGGKVETAAPILALTQLSKADLIKLVESTK